MRVKFGKTQSGQSGNTATQPGAPEAKGEGNKEWLQAYSLIADAYHRIDDFRAKLLALLPLASGTVGIFLLLRSDLRGAETAGVLVAVGIFGFLTTLGLAAYEARGIQRCRDLIRAGKQLERRLDLPLGEVNCREFRLGVFDAADEAYLHGLVGPLGAALLIYVAVLAGWIYLIVVGLARW